MATIAMSLLRYLSLLVLGAVTALGIAVECAMSAEAGPPKSEFVLTAQRQPDGGLKLRWSIAAGDYLYREQIAVRGAGRPIVAELPTGDIKDDPTFGPTEVYHREATAVIGAEDLAGVTTLTVEFQGCSERGICYPPRTASVDVASLAVAYGGSPIADAGSSAPPSWTQSARAASQAAFGLSGHPFAVWAAFLGFGLLLAFTPCVLPMVPILVGLLSRSSADITAARGFMLSSVYVLAMALAYGTLGVAAAWSGRNLQMVLQAPAILGAMAFVFVGLALASFGLFHIRLPAFIGDALAGQSTGRLGAVTGAAALGFTSALIVGPCVTPPLAAALLYVAQTGDMVRGASALFALGLGMGLPLIAVGTFGSRILPRSGAWLEIANRIFGVIFLAVALVLLGRVLPAVATMALWSVLLVGAGVFAGAFDHLSSTDGAVPRLRKTVGLLTVVYGLAVLVGAAGGSADPLRPLDFLSRGQNVASAEPPPIAIRSVAELDAALTTAPSDRRPVLLSFSAEWCSSCKTMEREVFAEAGIRERLRGVRLIRADVTKTDDGTAALMHRFGVVGPPTLVFIDPRDRQEITSLRSTGEISVDEFRRLLDRAT